MPEPSYTTISDDPFMEVRFAGKVFRCEATDGVMTLAAMVHVLYDLIEWVDDCMVSGFQGAPANWSYTPEPPEPPPRRKIYKKLRRVPRPTTADVAISVDMDEVPSARGEADLGVGGDPPG